MIDALSPTFALAVAVLLLLVTGCRSAEKLLCSYGARESANHSTLEEQEFRPRGACATRRADGRIAIDTHHLDALDFGSGVASVLTAEGWYYVLPDGRAARVLSFDNGPDYFSEGLARTIRSGKIGFIDRNLTDVISPSWDFAFPFRQGTAVVCQGCRSHSRPGSEHSEVRGGAWGRINRVGEVVVPVRFERDSLPAASRRLALDLKPT